MDAKTDTYEVLPRQLTPAYLERVAREAVRESSSAFTMQVGAELDTSPLADGHLVGVMSRLLHGNRRSRLKLSNRWSEDRDSWLTTSIPGFVIARMVRAASDQTDRDVLATLHDAQARHLSDVAGTLRGSQFFAYPVVDTFPSVTRADAVDSLLTRSSTHLRRMLDLELEALGLQSPHADSLVHVIRFLVEVFENTEVHGHKTLTGQPIEGMRLLSARRWFMRDLDELTWDYGENSAFRSWIHLLQQRGYQTSRIPLVEFTVADSGIGIAAHHERSIDIYSSGYADEASALRDAFRKSARKESFSGVGLRFALDAVSELHGFLAVRTGRSFAWRHYLDVATDFDHLHINIEDERTLYGGTAISIIVPWNTVEPTLFDAS